MAPPITRLPPELLVLTFERLDPEERTFCAMSRRNWQKLIKNLWPALKTSPNGLRVWAAKTGSLSAMRFAKKYAPQNPREFSITDGLILNSLSRTFNFDWHRETYAKYRDNNFARDCRFITSTGLRCTRCPVRFNKFDKHAEGDCCGHYNCWGTLKEVSPPEVATMLLGSLNPAEQNAKFTSFDIQIGEGYLIVTPKDRFCAFCERICDLNSYFQECECGEDGEPCEWWEGHVLYGTPEKLELRCQLIPQNYNPPQKQRFF